jgi:CheY-like chemotaxis protein
LSAFGAMNDPEVEKAAHAWLEQPLETESMLAALSRVLQMDRQPSRVLLVEDDADLAKVILATFERAGVQVHHAPTQRKAMELCVASRPDLVILDIGLPDGDGFGLVDWLRQQQEMKLLPLVVYSAQDLSESERQKLRLGHTEFLTKARVQLQDVETLVLTMLRQPSETTGVPLGWEGTGSPSL